MGGGTSKSSEDSVPELGRNQEMIVQLMMPLFYTSEALTPAEHELASNSWALIMESTAPEYLAQRTDPSSPCIAYFYESFYGRLFDIHPLSKDLFKDISTQGKFLVKMLSLSLSEKADPEKCEKTLVKLAEVHNERGIKAVEYGIVGEVLFWTLNRCIGSKLYTAELHLAWVKIMSRMLRTMVPVAVAYELRDGSAQSDRFLVSNIRISPEEEVALKAFTKQ